MATFRKRNNRWRAEVVRNGARLSATFDTKAQAQAWATSKEAEIINGQSSIKSDRTLKDACLRYKAEVSPTKRGAHWECLRLDAFIRDMPFINKRLSDIQPERIAAWRDFRLQSVSGSTIKREFGLLSSVFTHAIKEWRWCSSNPVKGIIMPESAKPRDRLIAQWEIDAILKALTYEPWAEPTLLSHELALAFLLAIESAMRRGEILSLEWRHVHLKERYVHLPITKNGHSRDVPLSTTAVKILSIMKKVGSSRTQVFALKNPTADTLFRKARERAEITGLTFHDTRHEATTRLAKKLGMLELARVTGHKDPRMLMVYYNETASELANKLD